MQILGLTARNIGDGTTVELSWSTADPTRIRHFIVQRWDRHRRRWVAYDGFHGIVQRIVTEVDDNPPQRVLVEIEDAAPSQQTLRVKAIFQDGEESDWATTSVYLASQGVRLGDSKIWYVREGLLVQKLTEHIVQVNPGFAVCAGLDRSVPSPISLALPDNAANMTYLVFINEHGTVHMAADPPTPSMYLARVYVDSAGHISDIQDLRFLWPPENLSVHWSPRNPRHATVSWAAYSAINLKEWRVWRRENEGPFVHVADVDKESTSLEDQIPHNFEGVIAYQIAAVDLGDNVSTRSLPVEMEITQATAPLPPTNLRARWTGSPRNPRVLLQWDPSPSPYVEKYNVYRLSSGEWLYWGSTEYANTTYLDASVSRGETITYAVTAVSEHRQESELSDSVTVTVGPSAVPKAPEWPSVNAITTGQDPDGTVWIRLRWHEVTERVNGDPIGPISEYEPDGLEAYDIWLIDDDDEHRLAASLPATAPREWEVHGLTRGKEYTYVIRARDGFGYESADSTRRSIIAGDTRIPNPPELTRVESIHDGVKDVVEVEWSAPTHYVDSVTGEEQPMPSDLIQEYVVYRSSNPYSLIDPREIARTGDTVFVDATVRRGQVYRYAVKVITKTGNESEMSNDRAVEVGIFEKPPAPVWVSVTTEVDEDLEVKNTLRWDWDESKGGRPQFLRGVGIYEGYEYRQIGFVPAQPDGSEPKEFVHRGLENGRTYRYFLKAIDTSGNESDFTEPKAIVAGSLTKPAAPVMTLTPLFEDGVASIRVSWEPVEKDAEGHPLQVPVSSYRIYRSTSGMHYSMLQEVNADETSFVDAGLTNGQYVYYRIAAVNALGVEGEFAQGGTHAGDITPPGVPNVTITPHFSEQHPSVVTLEIEASSEEDDVAGFWLYASTNALKRTRISYSEDGHFVEEMSYGSTLHFWVTAVDKAGNESEAYYESITPVIDDPEPVDADTLSLTFLQEGEWFEPRLTWEYPEDAPWIRHFEIYMHDEELGSDILIGSAPADQRVYVGGRVAGGKEYTYGIRVRSIFESRSDITYITAGPTKDVDPKPPVNVEATGDILSIFVAWDPPTEYVDGTPLGAVRRYIIEASYDDFTNGPQRTFVSVEPSIIHNVSGEHVWKYRVKAEDLFGNQSEWAYSNEAQAEDLDIDLDDAVPSQPKWTLDSDGLPMWSTGIDSSSLDEMQYAWVELHWQKAPESYVVGYHIEYSDDGGTSWHRVQQASASANTAKVSRLLTGVPLSFRIIAFTKLGTESPPSTVLDITTAGDTAVPPAPTFGSVTEGRGLLGVEWEPVNFARLAGYELQFQATTNSDIQDPNRWPSGPNDEHGWRDLPGGKLTFYLHDELRYDQSMDEGDIYVTYYRYRVRAVSMSKHPGTGKPIVSSWFIINPDGNRPRQTGQQDLATGSIVTRLLHGQIIYGEHINFHELTGDHLKLKTLTGEHLQAKSIRSEHLEIYPGAQNWVKNSAFGMQDLSGNLGVDWELNGASIVNDQDDAPLGRFALHLNAEEGSPVAIQALEPGIAGQTAILSSYVRLTNVDEAWIEIVADDEVVGGLSMTGSSGWTRLISEPFRLPENADLFLRCRIGGQGQVWISGIKLELGDLATDWLPYPGESYAASGSVQINTEGIRITNGRLLIQTDGDRLRLTSQGLFVGDDGLSHFASLTHEGLEIINGKFSLKTGNDTLIINHEGISAYRDGAASVKIGIDGRLQVFDGNMVFKTAQSGSRLELDHDGLRGYHQSLKTFDLDTQGFLTLRGGRFRLLTADNEQDAGITFTASGLTIRDKDGPTIQMSSDGTMRAARGFVLGPANPDPASKYLRIDPTEIYGQDGSGKFFRLTNEGYAEFTGSIVIRTSPRADRQVVIDSDGIYMGDKTGTPTFLLTHGFSGRPPGLFLNDTPEARVQIKVGDVLIDGSGITIDGEKGLVITTGHPAYAPVIHANHAGIQVLAGAGILVKDSGTIAFADGATAIDASGIHAEAITTGTLTISGDSSNTAPRLVVMDYNDPITPKKVEIDRAGIHVFDGALNVYGRGGRTIIQNGEINTRVLAIGHVGGANVVRNGRGDFVDEDGRPVSWQVAGGSLVQKTHIDEATGRPAAGRSGINAMRFAATQSQGRFWQELSGHDFSDDTYVFQAQVWLIRGSLKAEVLNAVNDDTGEAASYTVDTANSWQEVFIRIRKDGGTPTVRFTAGTSNTLAYVTDVMITKGLYAVGFQNHTDELAAVGHGVYINERGLQVYNGQLEVRTANDSLRINQQGIFHKHFELADTGLRIAFDEQNLTLDNRGLVVGQGNKTVTLNASGLTVEGGAVLIKGVGSDGYLTLDNNKIFLGKTSSNNSISITPEGLTITDGAFKLISTLYDAVSNNYYNLYIGDNGLRIGPSESNPVLALGEKPDGSMGLHIENGSVTIVGSGGGEDEFPHVTTITDQFIETRRLPGTLSDGRHVRERYSRLESGRLIVGGTEMDPYASAIAFVDSGTVEMKGKSMYVEFRSPHLFEEAPHVIVSPAFFETVKTPLQTSQYIDFQATNITTEGFTLISARYIAGGSVTGKGISGSSTMSGKSGTYEYEFNSMVLKADLTLSLLAAAGHRTTAKIYYRGRNADKTDWAPNWEYFGQVEVTRYWKLGGGSTFNRTIQFPTRDRYQIRVVHDASYGGGSLGTCQTSVSIKGLDLSEDPSGHTVPPRIQWLAIERT